MADAAAAESQQESLEGIVLERRRNRRYRVRLPVRYRLVPPGGQNWNPATTCEMSSVGLSFFSQPLPVGAFVEMVIDWPIRYGDAFPIELHAAGRVLRNYGGRTAVSVTSRAFQVLETAETALSAGAVV